MSIRLRRIALVLFILAAFAQPVSAPAAPAAQEPTPPAPPASLLPTLPAPGNPPTPAAQEPTPPASPIDSLLPTLPAPGNPPMPAAPADPPAPAPLAPDSGFTELVSHSGPGIQANQISEYPVVSADGRYIAFDSSATNLVPGDSNGRDDVFVRDPATGVTERVSLASDEAQGDGDSYDPAISADGRFVAFSSSAANLVPGDSNGSEDVFVRDRLFGTTERVSIADNEAQGTGASGSPSISSDGRYIAFDSFAANLVLGDSNASYDIFVRDRALGTTERVSLASGGAQGDNTSVAATISADGRFVAFESSAANLVAFDTNADLDIFVRDRALGTTERVSLASGGAQGDSNSFAATISADGRYIAFESSAANLVPGDSNANYDIFVRDRALGTTERVSVASDEAQANGESFTPAISADGQLIAFTSSAPNLVPGDSNGRDEVFVRDRTLGTTERVSVSDAEAQASGVSHQASISADGRYIAFQSFAANLVPGDSNGTYDIFRRDRALGTTERVSLASDRAIGNNQSNQAEVSGDGRYVAFRSSASNLVSGDTNATADIFVHDRQTGVTERVSIADDEAQANSISHNPSISSDGRYIAFESFASNLVAGDTNAAYDVFVRDRLAGSTERVSLTGAEAQVNGDSFDASISVDGRYVAFASDAATLVGGDSNNDRDIFVRDRTLGTTERVSLSDTEGQADDTSSLPSISSDGRYIAFQSIAANLVPGDTNANYDIFLRDRSTGTTERISVASDETQANSISIDVHLSGTGRFVAFASSANNLVPGDSNASYDIFLRDRVSGTTERISVSSSEAQGDNSSRAPWVSPAGTYVVFDSTAANLVSGDTNAATDIFVRNRLNGTTERVSLTSAEGQANDDSIAPSASTDLSVVVFASKATNLAVGDDNGAFDAFARDMLGGFDVFLPLVRR